MPGVTTTYPGILLVTYRAYCSDMPGVSADDTDLILQSDQSVACVNSRLAWSFEWAWMIYAVSVGHRVSTYNTTV